MTRSGIDEGTAPSELYKNLYNSIEGCKYVKDEKTGKSVRKVIRSKQVQYYDYPSNDIVYCDICGKIFESSGARNFHKSAKHNFVAALNNPNKQWDFGQLDVRIACNALWNDFMHEHDLPKVIFLFDWEFLPYSKKHGQDKIATQGMSYMPRYFKNKVLDLDTGLKYDAIIMPKEWFLLDPDAKAAALAHVAVHIENERHKRWDLTFNKLHRHTREFRRTAVTYDLFCANVPIRGYAITYITEKFRHKHAYAMRMFSRYHKLKVLSSGSRAFQCQLGGFERDADYDYALEWQKFD